MGALLYLEWRYTRHQIAAIVRSPLRLAIWIPYALSIAYLVWVRVAGPRSGSGLGFGLPPYTATAVGGLYTGLLGVTIALAANGRVAAFRSGAEALLLSNAGVRPLTIAVWLQVRKLATSSGRYLGTLVYVFLIFAPRHAGIAATARALVATLLVIAVQMSTELPVFLLARGRLRVPVIATGYAVAAFGFAYALVGFLGRDRFAPLARALRFDPGVVVRAVLAGTPFTIVTFAALVALLGLTIRILGSDALPELYAVSQRSLAWTRGRHALASSVRFERGSTRRAVRVPPGALAMVWKDWVGFKRGRGVFSLWLAGCAFWSLCGAGIGTFSVRYHDATLLGTLIAPTGLLLLVSAPFGASVGLAADLGKPLFWLSHAPLRARITAWTFARSWRGALAIGLGPLVAGIVMGDARLAFVALPLVFAAYWALQTLGVGLYAVFPNPLDSRGPMMLLRTLVTFAFAVPAALVGAVLAVWLGDGIIASLGAGVALAAEGWVVVELASLRFSEHGAALATLARST